MSSRAEKNPHFIHIFEPLYEDFIDFNKIIIPFSEFGVSKKLSNIHDEIELAIKFDETHSHFQTVMLNEFTDNPDE